MVGDIIAITLLVLAVVCSIVLIYRRATGKAGCSCGGACTCGGASACATCACALSYRTSSQGMSFSSSSSEVRHE